MMKLKIIVFALFCGLLSIGQAAPQQGIVQAEYFIDTDPGLGQGKQILSLGDTLTTVETSLNIDVSLLSNGIHYLSVRARNELGNWSFIAHSLFYKGVFGGGSTISTIEYSIDSLMPAGKGTVVNLAQPANAATATLNIDLSVLSAGNHVLYVTGIDACGVRSMTQSKTFNNAGVPSNSQLQDTAVCGEQTVRLYDKDHFNRWFESDTSKIAINLGQEFITPKLTETKTYYAQSALFTRTTGVGKLDNAGTGAYCDVCAEQGIVFDTYKALILASSKVYASVAGYRTISLYNKAGVLVQSKSIYIPSGERTIELGFEVPVGTDWKLTVNGACNLYRNTNGTTAYPYTVSNLITIKNNTTNDTKYYYYFYNLTVLQELCQSDRVPVKITVHPLPSVDAGRDTTICLGNSLKLDATGGSTYIWSSGTKNGESYVPTKATKLYVTATDDNNCSVKDSLSIAMKPAINVKATDIKALWNQKIYLTAPVLQDDWKGTWSVLSGRGADIQMETDPKSMFSGIPANNYQLKWSVQSATCGVSVDTISVKIAALPDSIPLESLTLPQFLVLKPNELKQLEVVRYPLETTDTAITWQSTDTAIVKVDAFGKVFAKAAGFANISAIAAKGAFVAVCNVQVSDTVSHLNRVFTDSVLYIAVNDHKVMNVNFEPSNAQRPFFEWRSLDKWTASVDAFGTILGNKIGSTNIIASVFGNSALADTFRVVVGKSFAPVVKPIPPAQVRRGSSDTVWIDLSRYVSDDITPFDQLYFDVAQSDNFIIEMYDKRVAIIPFAQKNLTENILLSVKDADGMITLFSEQVTISSAVNRAPISKLPDITLPSAGQFKKITISQYLSDDFTAAYDCKFELVQSKYIAVIKQEDTLTIQPKDMQWKGRDTIICKIIDENKLFVLDTFIVSINQAENKPPLILPIAEQIFSGVAGTLAINLNQYVTDDFTIPQNITWTTGSSSRITIKIADNILYAQIADQYWAGTDTVYIKARDEQGLVSARLLYFTQIAPLRSWTGAPNISFGSDRQLISRNEQVDLFASLTGASSWQWIIEGKNQIISDVTPTISWNKPGVYSISLRASNEKDTITLEKKKYITVVGIKSGDTTLCQGNKLILGLSSEGFDTYKWSNQQKNKTITIAPQKNTTYYVTVTKGLFTFIDSALVKIAPFVELGLDTTICDGQSIKLYPGKYVSYSWNNGSTDSARTVSDAGTYIVTVTDKYTCVSSDSVKIHAKYSLPQLSLNPSETICYGKKVSLNPGLFKTYKWNRGKDNPILEVDTSGAYSVTVTDIHGCKNSDTTKVVVLKPYQEQIGVVTVDSASSKVIVGWNKHRNQRTERYVVLRESSVANVWDSIGGRRITDSAYIFDKKADFETQAYRYKLRTFDSVCKNFVESDIHRTMHVRTSKSGTNSWINIDWNAYIGFGDAIKSYSVHRFDINGKDSVVNVQASNGIADLSFTDKNPISKAHYRVTYQIPEKVYPALFKTDTGPFSQSFSNMSEASVVSSPETETDGVQIYPNPTSDVITITATEAEGIQVSLIAENGAVVKHTHIRNGAARFEVADVAKGIYTVQLQTNNTSFSQKVLVK